MEFLDTASLMDMQIMLYQSRLQILSGRLIITPKRIWFKSNKNKGSGGFLSSLFSSSQYEEEELVYLDKPLEEVQFKRGKSIGKDNFILEVSTEEGKDYSFVFDDHLLLRVGSVISV